MSSTANDALYKIFYDQFQAAGITINGSKPWDIQIHDDRFYSRVLSQGILGLGEAYMDGWWDCEQLDQFVCQALQANLHDTAPKFKLALHWIKATLFNLQSRSRAFIVGEKHYDIGNDLFQLMLDKRMTYSCAYWENASDLDNAQEDKLELICQKLYLKPGMKILDIGCGWGSFCKYAAEKYKVEVVGITVSQKQLNLGRKICQGLPIELRLQDYRDINTNEKFDRIVSIGQFEHVGYKNYSTYMQLFRQCIKEDGLFLISSIGSNTSLHSVDPWIEKYIFPNGQLPSIKQIGEASEKYFIMEDWQNYGVHYDKTLMAWYENFNRNWDKIKDHFDERFYRMWKFYLLGCAGTFRSRQIQLWQIVFSPHGVVNGYNAIREIRRENAQKLEAGKIKAGKAEDRS